MKLYDKHFFHNENAGKIASNFFVLSKSTISKDFYQKKIIVRGSDHAYNLHLVISAILLFPSESYSKAQIF